MCSYPCTHNILKTIYIQRIWFDKICRVVGNGAHFVDAIYDDYLFKYDEKSAKWKKYWFLLDKDCLLQFRDMDHCDEYCKHGYFDDKEHNKAFNRYVQQKINLSPFDPKNVQKIRPGSNLQKKLIKECIFIIHSKDLGKLFFATEQQSQLNRWFKKIRSLAGDDGVRKKSKSAISVMSESSMLDNRSQLSVSKGSDGGSGSGKGTTTRGGERRTRGKRDRNNNGKNEDKILKMLRELEADFSSMRKDIKFVKKCWEKNNEEGTDDDQKYDDDDDEY